MRTFVLLVIVALCQVALAKKVAVFSSDMKLDDKSAIHFAAKSGKFDQVVVLLNGIQNFEAAHGELLDFMKSASNVNAEISVYGGERTKEAKGHEKDFLGEATAVTEYGAQLLEDILQGHTVSIFQIARTPTEHLNWMFNNGKLSINLYHLVHGYNSGYIKDINKNGEWLKNIQRDVRKNNPKATVLFTNNYASFDGHGGNLKLNDVKEYLPSEHLAKSLRDPFVFKQLKRASKVLASKGKVVLDAEKNEISVLPEEYKGQDLFEMVIEARMGRNDELRDHFTKYAKAAAVVLKELWDSQEITKDADDIDADNIQRLGAAVPKSLASVKVEMCDFNHVSLVLTNLLNADMEPLEPMGNKLRYMQWKLIMKGQSPDRWEFTEDEISEAESAGVCPQLMNPDDAVPLVIESFGESSQKTFARRRKRSRNY